MGVNQSKTPIWKKSMLQKLNLYEISDALCEISENGDSCGYGLDIEGYYNEYRDQFDELAAQAETLSEALSEYDVQGNWDDMTVALLGELYTTVGWDAEELDFMHLLSGVDDEWVQKEAVKRIMRLTKAEMLALFRRVLGVIVIFYDIKAAHDCLVSIVEELDERAAMMKRKDDAINGLYEDLTGKNAEQFEQLVRNLPQRMWVE